MCNAKELCLNVVQLHLYFAVFFVSERHGYRFMGVNFLSVSIQRGKGFSFNSGKQTIR